MALESIVDHIADDNPRAALEVAQRIWAAVSQLAQHPRMGRKGRVRDTSELIIQGIPYIVPYRIKGQEVQVLSVYHSSRKWPDLFG
jgi:toxin ParE1/3/4